MASTTHEAGAVSGAPEVPFCALGYGNLHTNPRENAAVLRAVIELNRIEENDRVTRKKSIEVKH